MVAFEAVEGQIVNEVSASDTELSEHKVHGCYAETYEIFGLEISP